MKNTAYILLLALMALPLSLMGQNERVGVNTRTPSEQLDVRGTARIESLPKKGEGITTDAHGDYDASKSQLFTPDRIVVADPRGVLGTMKAAWPLFFYMPSYVMPTETTAPEYNGVQFVVDLHKIYRERFQPGLALVIPPATASPSAGALPVEQASDLGYFVTYYDPAVFKDVAVSDAGVLTYKLVAIPAPVTENTFMNIVFKRL